MDDFRKLIFKKWMKKRNNIDVLKQEWQEEKIESYLLFSKQLSRKVDEREKKKKLSLNDISIGGENRYQQMKSDSSLQVSLSMKMSL